MCFLWFVKPHQLSPGSHVITVCQLNGGDTWTMFLLPEVIVSKMLWELLFKSQLVYSQCV